MTEYLTREIARRIGAPQANSLYTPCLPAVERLAAVIGESALCEAFFHGDFGPAPTACLDGAAWRSGRHVSRCGLKLSTSC